MLSEREYYALIGDKIEAYKKLGEAKFLVDAALMIAHECAKKKVALPKCREMVEEAKLVNLHKKSPKRLEELVDEVLNELLEIKMVGGKVR